MGAEYNYLPLTNRVPGPYCKLQTKFFPVGLSMGNQPMINQWGKMRICNLQYGLKKTRLVTKDIHYISEVNLEHRKGN